MSGLRHRTIGATSSNLSNHSVLHRHSSYPRCMLRSYAPSSHPFLVFPAILDLRLHSKHNRASLLFLRRIALQHDVAMFRSLHRRRCTPCILYSILFFFSLDELFCLRPNRCVLIRRGRLAEYVVTSGRFLSISASSSAFCRRHNNCRACQ